MTRPPAESDPQSAPAPKQPWLTRGAWALLDQGLFAGANFVIHVLLARQLSESSYGAFASAFALFLLLGTVHTSFLTEPMMVFGSGRFGKRLASYYNWLLTSHLKLTVSLGAIMLMVGGVSWAFGEATFAAAVFAFALAQVFMLLPWMLRDACYIHSNPRPAALSGAVYLAAVVGGLFVLQATGWLNVVSAVLLMGAGAALASAMLIASLRIPIRLSVPRSQRSVKARRHWRYGRWAAATNVIRFLPEQFPYLLLPLLLTYADGGAYKAVTNLTVPFGLVIVSISVLMLPVMVRQLNKPGFNRLLIRLGVMMVLPPLVFWPVLAFAGPWLIDALYEGKYVEHAGLLWIIAAVLPVGALGHLLQLTFKAAERSDQVFHCAVASCVVLVLVSVPMTLGFGLDGMAGSILLAYAVQAAVAWVLFHRQRRDAARSSALPLTKASVA